MREKVLECDKCPICMNIMIEPVTLPCKHDLCRECLDNMVSESAIQCPLCRLRLSNWLRKAKSSVTLINEDKWKKIRNRYPIYVAKKMADETILDESNICEPLPPRQLAKPGELRAEYEKEMKRLRIQWEADRRAEEEASLAFVRQLSMQEEDEEIDLSVLQVRSEQQFSSPSEDIRRSNSFDSITRELNSSFRPIHPSPRTPPQPEARRSPGLARCWPVNAGAHCRDKENRSPIARWLATGRQSATTSSTNDCRSRSAASASKQQQDFSFVRSPVQTRAITMKRVDKKKKNRSRNTDTKQTKSRMLSAFLTISRRLED